MFYCLKTQVSYFWIFQYLSNVKPLKKKRTMGFIWTYSFRKIQLVMAGKKWWQECETGWRSGSRGITFHPYTGSKGWEQVVGSGDKTQSLPTISFNQSSPFNWFLSPFPLIKIDFFSHTIHPSHSFPSSTPLSFLTYLFPKFTPPVSSLKGNSPPRNNSQSGQNKIC